MYGDGTRVKKVVNTQEFLEKYFDVAFAAPDGIKKLRELILSLAMQGKLVAQDPHDVPASKLLKEIEAEKNRLVKDGKIKQSKPLLEIKPDEVPYDLPKSWEWAKFGEIYSLEYGDSLPTSKRTNTGEFPVYGSNGIVGTHNIFFVNSPCIVVGRKGSAGALNLSLAKGCCVTDVAYYCLPPKCIDLIFSFQLFHILGLDSLGKGIVPGLNRNEAYELIIPIPPLAEQHRIVAKIDELMERCDELEKLRDNLNQKQINVHTAALDRLLTAKDQSDFNTAWQFITQHFGDLYSVKENVTELCKAILQLAVMGKLVPQDPLDRPASELLQEIEKEKEKLVKEKKLKIGQLTNDTKEINENIKIPSSWIWVKGVDLFFITKLAGFEYTEHINLLDFGEVPVIRAQNVKPFGLNIDHLKYIDLKTSKLLERCALTKTALLVTFIGAGIGDVALFDFQERWHLAPNVAKMEPFSGCENKVNPKYITYFLNSPIGRNEIFKHLKSTAQPSISMGTIRDIDYPLPPLNEQHRIVAKIDQLMALCDNLEKQIDEANSKQTNLLNAVMTKV